MDPKYKLFADFTGTFVPAHADLKPAIAYKLAQQEWNNSSNSIVKYCSLSSLWLHKQRLLKSDVLAVQYLRRERVRTSAGGEGLVKCGQGEGGQKWPIFCGRPLWTAPLE